MTMRITIAELCDKLGVGYVLGPYQTHPWSCHDAAKGQTCSAEVHVGPDNETLEAEAQMMYEAPPEGKPPMEQICHIRAVASKDGQWSIASLRVKGAPYGEGISNWDEKCCVFFSMLVGALRGETIPDIDELIEEAFHSRERFNSQRQGGGGKAPKVRAGQLLNMKKGGGF
jgi:hypothetical protein